MQLASTRTKEESEFNEINTIDQRKGENGTYIQLSGLFSTKYLTSLAVDSHHVQPNL